MQVGAKTDLGRVRKVNEDSYLLLDTEDWQLYAIADGMGGHQAGEVASALAIDSLRRHFSEQELTNWEDNWRNYLAQAFQDANQKIISLSEQNVEQQGMGTTLTAVLHMNGRLYIGHVGDSRLYLINTEGIRKITNDHSLVEELVRQGEMTQEEAKHHPQRNILLRALGSTLEIGVDLYEENFAFHDIMLLSTDGLTNLVEEEEIRDTVLALPPEKAVEKLAKLANKKGGHDNITIIAVKNTPQEKKTKILRKKRIGLSRLRYKFIILSLLTLILAGYYYWGNSYFLGFYQNKVAIFKGIPFALNGFRMSTIEEVTNVDRQEVVAPYQERMEEGIMVSNKGEAYSLIKDVTSLP